jgi:thiol-disulfide isomerase/thioredoxin
MIRKTWTLSLDSMQLRGQRILPLVIALAALTCVSEPTPAQQSDKVIVPLQINRPYEQSMMVAWMEFDEPGTETRRAGTRPASLRHGHLPGGLRVTVETNAESPQAYMVRIDTNADGNLVNESPLPLNLDSNVTVNVTRRWTNSKMATLPYTLSYRRDQQGRETFYWRPGYVSEGKLKLGKCESSIQLLDVNGDGVFDRGDFRSATSIRIDDGTVANTINLNDPRVIRHADGRIEIPDDLTRSNRKKWLRGEEIIEFCGESYLVDTIEPDGSALTLARTDMKVPRIGELLPAFVMKTLGGEAIDTKSLKGTITLLDFWASWCRPCVEKFGDLKEMVAASKGGLKVIAINVDESDLLPQARQVAKEYGLTWPQVANGQGERDLLWKVFGSMSNNGLIVPLYVLVDANGIISYAGNGGEHLLELRARVKELEQKKSVQIR